MHQSIYIIREYIVSIASKFIKIHNNEQLSENNVIGNNGKIPWHISSDLKFFKFTTTGNTVIMGRKTFESIGKPLPNRNNIIITRDINYKAKGCIIKHSLIDAINYVNDGKIFIIGGGEIYKEAKDLAETILLTRVNGIFDGDTFLPDDFLDGWFYHSEITSGDNFVIKSYKKNGYINNEFIF